MASQREIRKVGLALVKGDRILLVRKRGSRTYILPGGKPEAGEDDVKALVRELDEELGCQIDLATLTYIGSFSDQIADQDSGIVIVRLYSAQLIGQPAPQAEIEELRWVQPSISDVPLAPSLTNKIIPYLIAQGQLDSAQLR
jgi:8-oxo-dGTP diphosphatase